VARHTHAGQPCEHGSKAACEKARREALGRCVAMLKPDKVNAEPKSCTLWATDRVNGRPHCGQHYASAVNQELQARAQRAKQERLDGAIDRYIAGSADRFRSVNSWWAEHATPVMRTAHALLLMQAQLRDR